MRGGGSNKTAEPGASARRHALRGGRPGAERRAPSARSCRTPLPAPPVARGEGVRRGRGGKRLVRRVAGHGGGPARPRAPPAPRQAPGGSTASSGRAGRAERGREEKVAHVHRYTGCPELSTHRAEVTAGAGALLGLRHSRHSVAAAKAPRARNLACDFTRARFARESSSRTARVFLRTTMAYVETIKADDVRRMVLPGAPGRRSRRGVRSPAPSQTCGRRCASAGCSPAAAWKR